MQIELYLFSFCPCVCCCCWCKRNFSRARAHSNHYIIVRATHNDRIMNCIHVINKRAYKVGIWMTDWLADLFLFQQLSFSSRASLAIYQNLIYGFDLCVARLFLATEKETLYPRLQPPSGERSCTMNIFLPLGSMTIFSALMNELKLMN